MARLPKMTMEDTLMIIIVVLIVLIVVYWLFTSMRRNVHESFAVANPPKMDNYTLLSNNSLDADSIKKMYNNKLSYNNYKGEQFKNPMKCVEECTKQECVAVDIRSRDDGKNYGCNFFGGKQTNNDLKNTIIKDFKDNKIGIGSTNDSANYVYYRSKDF